MSAAAWVAPTSFAAAMASAERSPTVTATAPRRLPARLVRDTSGIVPLARRGVAGDLEHRDLGADRAPLSGDGRLAEDLHALDVRVPVGQPADIAQPPHLEAVALREAVRGGLLDA